MAEGGGTAPAEAMRGAKGVSVVVVAVVAIVLFVAGVGVGWLVFSPPAKRVSKLFLGTNTPFPPFEFYNNTSVLTGFDIELIQEIVHRGWGFDECTEAKTTSCYEWTDFQTFLPLLAAVGEGRIDIGVGAITLSGDTGAKRNATMDFSDSYYLSNQGVLKRAGDSRTFCAAADCTVAELDRSNLKIGAQEITTSEFWVEDNLPNVTAAKNLVLLGTVEDVLLALRNSVVDIVVVDLPVAQRISTSNPTTYAVAGTIRTNELYGFAVANNDPLGLLPVINAQLKAIKSDGTYNALITKWF
jgi:polar amino acid transport system substrate-binding protein